jgi:DNA-binding NarL/FixJ family response regulator
MIQDGSNVLQSSDTSIKILIADDSEIVRRGIRQLLSAQPEIAIVGEANNFTRVIQMASNLEPHVIVLDLHMPDENSIPPREIKLRLNHGSKLLVISVWNDEDSRKLAESIGAAVFLDKMDLASTLIRTIMQLKRERSARAE